MRIIHRVEKGKVTERLVSLDGSGREIIRNQNEVICYLPDRRTVLVEKRTDDSTLMPPCRSTTSSSKRTTASSAALSTKALGRRTQVILVQPRDQYRYGYRLWLDDETAMPLKSQLCDRNGNVIEQIVFAELNFRDRIPADAVKPSDRRRRVSAGCGRTRRSRAWRTRRSAGTCIRLPAGFRLTTWRLQIDRRLERAGAAPRAIRMASPPCRCSSSRASPQTEAMRGLAKVGAAFAYSRNLDGHQVTAVGEVPAATVEAIAAGVTQGRSDRASAPARLARTRALTASTSRSVVASHAAVDGLQPGRLQPVRAACSTSWRELLGPAEAAAASAVVDIGGEPELERKYGTRIPVLAADGEFVCAYRLDAERVASLLVASGFSPTLRGSGLPDSCRAEARRYRTTYPL